MKADEIQAKEFLAMFGEHFREGLTGKFKNLKLTLKSRGEKFSENIRNLNGKLSFHLANGVIDTKKLHEGVFSLFDLEQPLETKSKKEKDFVSFSINISAEIYVAYDARSKAPSWLTSKFKKADGTIKISDNTKFNLYKANFPAGKVTLGGNNGNKGMYLILLKKVNDGKVTESSVKALVAKANTKLGEEIFFGRGRHGHGLIMAR